MDGADDETDRPDQAPPSTGPDALVEDAGDARTEDSGEGEGDDQGEGGDDQGEGGDDDGDDIEDALDEALQVADEAWHNLMGADGYLPVLVLLFAVTIAGPLIGDSRVGRTMVVVLSAGALVLTVYRSAHNLLVRRVTAAVAAFAVLAAAAAVFVVEGDTPGRGKLALGAYLILLLGAFPLVLVRSLQHRRVTMNTVCATVSAYLLIGLIFAVTYQLFGVVTDERFFAQRPTQGEHFSGGEYTYFSFITLTSVGYGDLSPGTDPGRALVMVEAVLGQVFVVTALARVVSLLGEERQSAPAALPPSLSRQRPRPPSGAPAAASSTRRRARDTPAS